jgi:serine/threonine protein kinase
VDFGFATKLEKKKDFKTYTNCGTPCFVAPEVINGTGHSFQADVWALGCLICELATGVNPFYDVDQMAMYDRIRTCQPQFNKSLPPLVKDLLQKIFVFDPELRFKL